MPWRGPWLVSWITSLRLLLCQIVAAVVREVECTEAEVGLTLDYVSNERVRRAVSCHGELSWTLRLGECMFGFAQVAGRVDYPEWCQGSVHAEKVP